MAASEEFKNIKIKIIGLLQNERPA